MAKRILTGEIMEHIKQYIIYKISNDHNNNCYIGRTARDIDIRWLEHQTDLRANRHKCKRMQEDFNRGYSFTITILRHLNTTARDAASEERRYINYFGNLAYNQGGTGEGDYGFSPNIRSICRLAKDGSLIKKYKSLQEATRDIGLVQSAPLIAAAKNTTGKLVKGSMWIYEDDYDRLDHPIHYQGNDWGYARKRVMQFTKDGDYVATHNSIKAAAIAVGLKNDINITQSLQNPLHHLRRGYIFILEADYVSGKFTPIKYLGREIYKKQ